MSGIFLLGHSVLHHWHGICRQAKFAQLPPLHTCRLISYGSKDHDPENVCSIFNQSVN